jgi:hypothetical protein
MLFPLNGQTFMFLMGEGLVIKILEAKNLVALSSYGIHVLHTEDLTGLHKITIVVQMWIMKNDLHTCDL